MGRGEERHRVIDAAPVGFFSRPLTALASLHACPYVRDRYREWTSQENEVHGDT